MTGKELAERAKRATGSKTAADLARALGLESYESPRRVARWLRGANEPDFESTLKLLELIGYPVPDQEGVDLIIEPLQDADALARLERLEQQQASFARLVTTQNRELHEIGGQQKDVLELLERVTELLERQEAGERDARGARAVT
jgi:transcriptional regulator with XRE-family HTH domain